MPNSSIMALALAMCNVEAGRRVKVPAQQLHLLMMWLNQSLTRLEKLMVSLN